MVPDLTPGTSRYVSRSTKPPGAITVEVESQGRIDRLQANLISEVKHSIGCCLGRRSSHYASTSGGRNIAYAPTREGIGAVIVHWSQVGDNTTIIAKSLIDRQSRNGYTKYGSIDIHVDRFGLDLIHSPSSVGVFEAEMAV